MAHIVMNAMGAHGHVHPNLPVIAELVARGHRVGYAVPHPFAAAVAATGAVPLVHTSVLPDANPGLQWSDDPVDGPALILDEAIQALPQIAAALDGDRPDLFLADIGGYPAGVLARRWDVPLVQLSPAMVFWEGMERDVPEVAALLEDPREKAYLARFGAWLATEGVDEPALEFAGLPPRSLVLIPRVMQPHADRVDPARFTFVGPCLDARPYQGDWPAPERPLVVVSLGSAYTDAPAFFRTCAEAFGDGETQVVLAIGSHVEDGDLGPLPPHVTAHAWIPQLAALRHASLFVTHAGMGGASEGLATGTPMVAVPRAADQFGNAALLAEAGVAEVVAMEDVAVERLRAARAALSTPEVARRCADQAAELAAAGGASRAADLIEDVLG